MKTLTAAIAVAMIVAIGRATAGQQMEAQAPVAPRFLSQTGLYSDASTLKVDPRNRLFSPQYPLWSDGATKRRWVRLPQGAQINVADLGKWELPVGTKFWKEFSFNGRKVETRFLWRTSQDHWVFASYVWNGNQTDAEIASEDGVANIAEIVDGKRHSIPSLNECRSCHDSNRTETLGFDALQLSTDRDPNALHADPLTADMLTLKTLVDANLLTPPRPELVTNPPRIEASSPQTRAALGYLSTNCGSCHNDRGSIASLGLNLKMVTNEPKGSLPQGQSQLLQRESQCSPPLATTVHQRGHWVVPEAPEESRLINPGHPESSAIIRRVKSRRPISQMPPIGTVIVDREAVDLLTSWIANNPEEWKAMIVRCAKS